jgi:nucleotide-binding universal stress UspA family protein
LWVPPAIPDAGRIRLGRSAGALLAYPLLAHLECPLAVAPAGLRDDPKKGLKRIGVGFNASPESKAALALAASIASIAGATLEVRGAVDDAVAGGLRTDQIVLEGHAIIERQLISAFESDLAAAKVSGAPTRIEVEVGMPSDILAELGEQVDLLVIGSGHPGQPGRVQVGGTGRALLHCASCPILIVPRPTGRHTR